MAEKPDPRDGTAGGAPTELHTPNEVLSGAAGAGPLSRADTLTGTETVQIAAPDQELAGETVRIGLDQAEELDQNKTILGSTDDSPTRVFEPNAASAEATAETKLPNAPDEGENSLAPNRLRSALVSILLVTAVAWTVLNFLLISQHLTERAFRANSAKTEGGLATVTSVNPLAGDKLRVGDELVSINGVPFGRESFLELEGTLAAGQPYTLGVRRNGELLTVELTGLPVQPAGILGRYLLGLLLPFAFLMVAAGVFILKPRDLAAVLLTIAFCLLPIVIPPDPNSYFINQLPDILNFLFRAIFDLSMMGSAVLLHLFLIFPRRLWLIKRFPAVVYVVYATSFIFAAFPFWLADLSLTGWVEREYVNRYTLLMIGNAAVGIHLAGALAAMSVGYIGATLADKRRLRLIAFGFAIVAIPNAMALTVLRFLVLFTGDWTFFLLRFLTILLPFVFAYAIVRHKVIPISLVIRRGLQYLLAKNALRVLLLLPVIMILWNIASNPNKTFYEIVLHNSPGFYIAVFLVAALWAVNRFGLREWIDRKFFRRQYDKEVILRELGEAIQECDSISTLSRLVSEKIDEALHPASVNLFFRTDGGESDFSLSYTTTGGESPDLKIQAESPILRFLQTERRAIDLGDAETGDLPLAEEQWLRSLEATLLVPMHGTDRRLAGFFTLGEKRSEIPYTGNDKKLLMSLANQIALLHENLSLKDRVRREQKIRTEVLSRVDAASLNLLKECPRCARCFDRKTERCPADNAELTFSLPVERTIEQRYRLEKLLGRGAMGAVYEATDTRINRSVAVKILSGAMFGNSEALRRFQCEARTAGRVQHPNIVTIFDYGVLSTGGAFLVMELVRGKSLRQVLDNRKTLPHRVIVDWFGQVLNGIEAAHTAGILHRDLKPANIVVTEMDGEEARMSILDFGLAREQEMGESVTVPGTILGTFGYMPPEQLRGEPTNERGDLFAIAVMIYEAVHGERPFHGKTYHELLHSMSRTDVFYLNKKWAAFFKRGLAVEARRRFPSAAAMNEALRL